MKLLLVDDEESTREGLLKFVKWEEIGIHAVEIAENGEEAVELARKLLPDILLTDIRMPNMDGIELARSIKEFLPDCKIIFISGFADKEYLKSAIRLNALEYVEKPLDMEEVTDTLSRAVRLCQNDKERKEHERKAKESMDKSIPLLKQKIGFGLVSEGDEESILKELETIGFDTSVSWSYVTFAVKVKQMEGEELKDKSTISEEQMLMDIFSSDYLAPIFSGYNNDGIQILHAALKSSSFTSIHSFAERIKEYLTNMYQHQALVSIGVGKPVTSIRDIHTSFQYAAEAIKRIFFSGYGTILKYEETQVPYKTDNLLVEEFSGKLGMGERIESIHVIKKVTDHMNQMSTANIEKIRTFFLKLYMTLEAEIDKRGLRETILTDYGHGEEIFMNLETVAEISDFLIERIIVFFDILERKNRIGSSLFDIQEYIKRNCGDSSLSVKTIAEYANYSHYYLCSFFKKNTGITVNNYITKVRMEKAKELLKDKKMKLYEISKNIGYSNPNYFIKLFKKYEGCTPTEFKEKYYL